MHQNTSELFAETVEKTGLWLRELMQSMEYAQPHQAYSLLRAVLHVLRDRLTVEGAAKLGAQLPTLVRGLYYEGWHPAGVPAKLRHKQEFLDHVVQTCPSVEGDPEGAVLAVLRRHVTAGEIRHLREQLPEELRSLCPS